MIVGSDVGGCVIPEASKDFGDDDSNHLRETKIHSWKAPRRDQVPILQLSPLCYFWNYDSRIWLIRVWVVAGLVIRRLDDVTNFVREKPMFCTSAMFKKAQRIEIVPTYYKENFGRSEGDVTEEIRSLGSDWSTTWTHLHTRLWLTKSWKHA